MAKTHLTQEQLFIYLNAKHACRFETGKTMNRVPTCVELRNLSVARKEVFNVRANLQF